MKKVSALLLCLLLLGGCWDKQELEDNTFVVLLGLDYAAPEGGLTVTLAFPLTQQQGGSAVEGMDNGSGSYATLSATAGTMVEAMSLFSAQLAGPIALHTVKTIVISQQLARSDMLHQVLAAWRYEEIRNTATVLVSADTAQAFIEARISDAIIDPMRQEELLLEQASGSAYYQPMKLLQLLVSLSSGGGDGVALYGGAVPEKEEASQSAAYMARVAQRGYLPGQVPISAENRSRITGLAVFRGGGMVGVLDSQEAQAYAMLTGGKGTVVLTLPDPLDPVHILTAELRPGGRSVVHGRPEGDRAVFDIETRLTCTVSGTAGGADYTQPQNHALLQAHIQSACYQRMRALIDRTQRTLRADILRLGDTLAWHFATAQQWADYSWAEQYPRADIGLTVRVDLEHMGIVRP